MMPQLKKNRIVLVEDDEDIAKLIKFKFKKQNLIVVWKSDGLSGLAEIQNEVPDLVILDIMLPKLNGFQILKKLKEKEQTKSIPIIILTVKSREADVVKGLKLGSDEYMTKPFHLAELMIRVKKLLAR